MKHWKQILDVALSEGKFEFARASGPGGQNVNKVETKAVWRWNLSESPRLTNQEKIYSRQRLYRHLTSRSEVLVSSDRFRSREQNIQDVLAKVRTLFEKSFFVRPVRKKTKPTKASQKKRVESKKRRGALKKTRSRVKDIDT